MKKIAILLLISNICYGQVKDFITRGGNIVQMRKYDSTSIANLLSTKMSSSDSLNYYGFTTRWRTQHIVDSLSLAFTPVNIYNSDGTIEGNRNIYGDGTGILSIVGIDVGIQAIDGSRISMGYYTGGGVHILGPSIGIHTSSISVFKDSISIRPKEGILNIDSLRSATSGDDLMTWNITGKIGHALSDSSIIPSFHLKAKSLISGTTPITYNPITGAIGIQQSSTSVNGYISSSDWNTFNGKLSSIDSGNISSFHLKVKSLFSPTAPITYSSTTGVIAITQSTTGANGYLSSTDWNTFNNKLATNGSAALLTSFPTLNQNTTGSAAKWTTARNVQGVALDGTANIDIISGTGFVKATGTSLSYDNSTYLTISSAASTYQPLDADLTTVAGLTATNDDIIQFKAGAWTNRTMAQLKTDLNLIGSNSGDQTITLTGDAIGSGTSSFAVTVGKINGTSLGGLATGILKNTTTTGVPSIAVAGDFPTLNQNTTGYSTHLAGGNNTTLLGSVPYQSNTNTTTLLSPNATTTKKFFTMTGDGTNGAAPGWNTIIAGDVPTLNQSTTGSAATLTTPRNIQGVSFNGSAAIDIINGTGFVKATGTTLSYDNSTYLTTASAASTYQPLDADLTTVAGLTATTDNFLVSVSSAWASRTPSQVCTTLALVPGTDIEVHDADLTTIAGLTATTDNFMVATSSAWASRTPTQARTQLGATTLGGNIFTLTNPSALGYIRANADNTVTHRSYANTKVDLSLDAVENTALSTWAGTSNVVTLGAITTGTWSATTVALNKGGTGSTTASGARIAILPSMTGNTLKVLRVNAGETDYELAAAGAGNGTVTNTGGNLTSNAVVLGAGTVDTKVVAGITTDGTSIINLGVNTTTIGKVKMFGNTSGDATVQPAAIAGTATVVTLPNASSTLPIFGQQITFSGPTAARTITLPDAAFTAARTDAAQTFTGTQTFSSTIVGSVNGNAATVTTNANLTGDVTSVGNATTIASPSETAVDNNSGGWVRKKVSGSDVTTTGQTLVDVTGLVSGTVSASATYEVQGMLIVTTSTGTNGTEYGLNCTGTGADQSINWIGPSTEGSGVQVLNEVGTGNNNIAGTPAFLTTASMAGCIWFHGYVTTGTGSPTMAIRHLKATSGTSTVKIGSIFEYKKL